ncbi:MAG: hypothetical protein FD123_1359, partial [Bacteroidetes bacterium]
MRKTYKAIVAALILSPVIFCSCSSGTPVETKAETGTVPDYSKLKELNWLIGKWENNSSEGYAAETWEQQNDSTLEGASYFVAGGDTVSSEKLSLVQTAGDLFYIPVVKDQNNGQPVKFKMTSQSGNQLVFENPSHDFPKKITYNRITNDSIVAEISGMVEGKLQAQQFP